MSNIMLDNIYFDIIIIFYKKPHQNGFLRRETRNYGTQFDPASGTAL